MNKILTSKGAIDVNIPNTTNNYQGEHYMVCPICTPHRKSEHIKDKKLCININKSPMPWRCNHCNEGGYVKTEESVEREIIKPLPVRKDGELEIGDSLVDWFWEKRKISLPTLKKLKISKSIEGMMQHRTTKGKEHLKGKYQNKEVINFNYLKDDVLINVKFRDNNKNFKMVQGATKIPYNFDSIKESSSCIITEGEIDVAAYVESGILPVISVPNGVAISDKERLHFEKTGEMKIMSNINLEYLDLVYDDMEHLELIYIATDDDAPGIKLREELARRLGYERCKFIKYGDFKNNEGEPINDCNQLLIERGKNAVIQSLELAHSFPINDVTTAEEHLELMVKELNEGVIPGLSTGYACLDPFFNWVRGWLVVLNGFPNQGKTSFALSLMAISAVKYKWKWGIYCPENYPVKNVIKLLVQILIGKSTSQNFKTKVNEKELIDVVTTFINKYFFFVDREDGFTPKELREVKKRMIKQYGIVGFLTDPWGSLNDPESKDSNTDRSLKKELNEEVRLTTKYNLINLICHHPKTVKNKAEAAIVPSVFELDGGKNWWIKIYAALCVHQENIEDWKDNRVGIHVQKIKDKQIAGETTGPDNYPIFGYQKSTGRFREADDLSSTKHSYTKFPFVTYCDADQKELFNGY